MVLLFCSSKFIFSPLLSSVWINARNFSLTDRLAHIWINKFFWVLGKTLTPCTESQTMDNDNYGQIWPNNGKIHYQWWLVLINSTFLESGHMWYRFIQPQGFPLQIQWWCRGSKLSGSQQHIRAKYTADTHHQEAEDWKKCTRQSSRSTTYMILMKAPNGSSLCAVLEKQTSVQLSEPKALLFG